MQKSPIAQIEPVTGKSALDELEQWERFAIKRLGQETHPFNTHVLEPELAFEISTQLITCEDADAIKAVFDVAREKV